MTLVQAIEILNAERHRGYEHWQLDILGVGLAGANGPPADDCYRCRVVLTEIEAVAVAERYVWLSLPRQPGADRTNILEREIWRMTTELRRQAAG